MEIEKIYNQYLADNHDGFVSNDKAYFESLYGDRAEEIMKMIWQ